MNIYIQNMIRMENPPASLANYSKAALTFDNPLYNEAKFFGRYTRGINKYIKLHSEETGGFSKNLLVPRGFLEELLAKCKSLKISVNIVDNTSKQAESIDFGSVIKLRDYQEPFVESIIKTKYGGVAIAPAGAGKTIMALEAISRLGMRTLWLTHTSDLARQTTERAKEFLPKAELGLIGSGKWKEGDLTIALVQTLIRRDVTELGKSYPLVMLDECHHAPSSTFTETLTALSPFLMIGLSATPYRKDGLEDIMFGVLGPAVVHIEKKQLIAAKQLIPATIIQRNTGIKIDERISDYKVIMDKLYESEPRLNLILGDIIAEASTEKNICVVLTRTIDYGKRIFNKLESVGFKPSFVYSAEIISQGKKVKRTRAMPRAEREDNINNFLSGKTNIIIATIKFLAEGFDHKPLNRLFIVNPISHRNRTLIEQACGRVERPFEGETEAIVYDYVDEHSLLKTQAMKRIEVYEDNLMSVKQSDMKTDYLI